MDSAVLNTNRRDTMNQEQFIANYVAKNAGKGRKALSVEAATQAAKAEWDRMQDPAYVFRKTLLARADGKYWNSDNGSKARIYFSKAGGYFDLETNAWMLETSWGGSIPDTEGKIAAALGI
jgi:hypothetical protein